MKRLRLVLIALAVLLAVPTALLVSRALESVESERQARHRAVADLVFDEMDRQLATLVAREEARPFTEYSRRAALEGEPFILGWFEIEADGTLSGPYLWTEGKSSAKVAAALDAWHPKSDDVESRVAWSPVAQVAGTTVAIDAKNGEPSSEQRQQLDILRSVGLNANKTSARSGRKVEQVSSGELAALDNDGVAGGRRRAEARQHSVEVVTEPLVGHRLDADRLVLARSIIVDGRYYGQGLVVDLRRLRQRLAELTIQGGELAPHARLTWDGQESAATAFEPHVFQHRFAEPFAGVAATLHLAELPGPGGARYVVALAALLGVTALAGLGAVYEMTSVVVSFAERRSNFVSAVTHELKTPLTAIRMHAEMLRDEMVPTEEKKRQYYRTMTSESERLTRLVDNVLELSRLERGARPVTLVVGDVASVLREAAQMLEPHAKAHGFAIAVDEGSASGAARFDREALLQVLVNLVDNAIKYARDANEKAIVLACRREGDRVVVSVRDHGPGVAAAHVGRLFDPFYRGESEMTRRSTGLGLGLSLVKGLVERMGGSVAARNVPAGGFEVDVTLQGA